MLLFCLVSLFVGAQNIPSYMPTNGLVGYWPFNGNANDESGNGNHGTVNGASLTSDRLNNNNKSYDFNHIGSRIDISSNATLYPDTLFISAWFKMSSGVIMRAGDASTDGWKGWVIAPWLSIVGDSVQLAYWDMGGGAYRVYEYRTTKYCKINTWNHFALIRTPSTLQIYLNGQLTGSLNNLLPFDKPTSSPLIFGNNHLPLDDYAKGSLDDIVIYNRALTQQEITQLYIGNVTYNINASSGTNGSITPAGSTSVNSGYSQTYTFTPNSGYWIDSVIVNGTKVPTASSYTFSNVSSNQSIRVTYRSLAAALAAANICANDTTVATVNLPATSLVRATAYYSNIYLFNQNNTGNAYKYNVNDRKYTAIADKPTPCIECGVAEANGKIYCFNTNGTTQAYDIASNTWQNKASLPAGSGIDIGFYATSLNNKIYLIGGSMGLTQTAFYEYNPATNVFTQLSNPSQPNVHGRIITHQNLIYKIGGEYYNGSNSQAVNVFEVYNPSNNTWNALPAMPEALSRVGATVYDNKIYVFGGNVPYGPSSNKVYVFDFASNAWYLESHVLPLKTIETEAKTANNMVFLFGGMDTTNTITNQANRYFCKDQLCTCKWAEYVCNGVSSDNPCPTSSLYRPGTVFCNGYATKVVEVTNPITGKTWMDRNLGATRAAISSTDADAHGDLYQWGRGADGHQCRNSGTTSTLSTTDQPTHPNFILAPNSPFDWRTPQNNNLWQGVNGVNNPCPIGYRMPTYAELEGERTNWSQNNDIGAFSSPLKLPVSGDRNLNDGSLNHVGGNGNYWSSTFNFTYAWNLNFFSGNANTINNNRVYGFSVRCIKDYILPEVGTLDSIGSNNQGILTEGIAATNVNTSITYTNGNGGVYESQTITSTGVTGLTATLTAGTLNSGNGTLTLNITGTPNTNGTASFTITIGGKTCVFRREVKTMPYRAGTVFCNGVITEVVEVTNPITGKTWMDRNLGATRVATSSTDTLAYGDLYQWGRGADGHQCRNSATASILSSTDQPGHSMFIMSPNTPNDWRVSQNDNLWQGVNGMNNPCPNSYRLPTYNELIGEVNSWSQNNKIGAFSSPLKLSAAGFRNHIDGVLTPTAAFGFYWSSSIDGYHSWSMYFGDSYNSVYSDRRAYGFSVRCIKDYAAVVGTLDTIGSINQGVLYSGVAASNAITTLNYTGGNGARYEAQTITSSGVTGLTANLAAGTLNNGNGTLTLNITGTPNTNGTASFTITFGGKVITIRRAVTSSYAVGTVYCNGTATEIIEVTNPITGKTWMDRNLGATRVATSSTDTLAYGDLYQWGRGADGHQCRNSATTTTLSSTDQPGHANFILAPVVISDWRSPQKNYLWQGVNGVNNPCPTGYRLPTYFELEQERTSWSQNNSDGAFSSPLKLPMAGQRHYRFGYLNDVGSYGAYWGSTWNSTNACTLNFNNGGDGWSYNPRATGIPVRCIKD